MRILGISLGHDSSFALIEDGLVLGIMEAERFFRQKRYKLHCINTSPGKHLAGFQYVDIADLDLMLGMVIEKWGTTFDAIAVQNQGRIPEYVNLKEIIRQRGISFTHELHVDHHLSHASLAYFTSSYNNALVLSYDGMGNDGQTVLFKAQQNQISYLHRDSTKYGQSYNNLGFMMGVKPDVAGSTAGKTMGLAAYGNLRDDWLSYATSYVRSYEKLPMYPIDGLISYGKAHRINSIHLDQIKELAPFVNTVDGPQPQALTSYVKALLLGNKLKELRLPSVEHPLAQDLLHTVQHAWTEDVLTLVKNFRSTSENLCVVGGCALNGVTNYVIQQSGIFNKLHFVPNPTDCGLSAGAALYAYYKLSNAEFNGYNGYFTPYLGTEAFDIGDKAKYCREYPNRQIEEGRLPSVIAKLINDNRTIGVIKDRYEVGPRALGNRSILCNALAPNMRQLLNDKVKHREWYRPFAPVVSAEDANKYFTTDRDIPYMSVICYTKDQYREMLPSITHIDGSARLQTIRREQNQFLHSTIKAFEQLSGVPVILNTSFNPGGEPILNFCSVGLEMLKKTELDFVLIQDTLFCKPGREETLKF